MKIDQLTKQGYIEKAKNIDKIGFESLPVITVKKGKSIKIAQGSRELDGKNREKKLKCPTGRN